jgi:hypothetical protein
MAGLAAFVGANLLTEFVSTPIGAVSSAWTRELMAAANSQNPNQYPPVEALNRAYVMGFLSPGLFVDGLLWNGVAVNNTGSSKHSDMWAAVRDSVYPAVPIDVAFPLFGSGIWTPDQWDLNLRRSGVINPQARQFATDVQYKPTADEAIVQQFLGNFSDAQTGDILKFWGLLPGDRLSTLLQLSLPPGVNTTLQLLRQGRVTQADALRWIKATGLRYEPSILPQLNAAAENPPAFEQIAAIARGGAIWSPYYERWGLYAGIPPLATDWAARCGLGFQPLKNMGFDATVANRSWGELIWADSIPKIPPHDVAQMMFRFRPGRSQRFTALGIPVPAVNQQDVYNAFAVHGYTDEMAKGLTALAYRQISRFDIRAGVATGVFTQADASAYYQDLGYLPADAENKAKIDADKADKVNRPWLYTMPKENYETQIKQVVDAYEYGTVSSANAVAALVQLGFRSDDAQRFIDVANYRFNVETVKQILKSVETSFLHGDVSAESAAAILQSAGLQPDRIAAYFQRWGLARTLPHRLGNASQIIDWMRDGLLTQPQASAKLANLGIANADAVLMVAEANTRMAQLQAKQEAAQLKQGAQQAKELSRVQQQHLNAARKLAAQRTKLAPVSAIIKWLKAGIISPEQFTLWMQEKGFGNDTVADYVKQAESKAPAAGRPAKGNAQQTEATPPNASS